MQTNKKLCTLTNCIILTMDSLDHFYTNGSLVIEDGQIKEIGFAAEIEPRGQIYDFTGKMILPGLINTHTHSVSPLFRGMADDLELMDWLKKLIWPAEKHLSPEYAYWGASLNFLEFLKTGVTSFADQYFFAQDVARAAQKSGLRAFLAPTVFAGGSPETKDTLQAAADFIEKYANRAESRITPCIGPHAPYSCSDEDFYQVIHLAEKYDLLVHTHISETLDENKQLMEETGMSPTRYLESLGVLDQRVLAAHCIHLDEEDIQVFAKKGVRVSYNPVSNLKLVSGIMPMQKLRDAGVTVSLGTDGAQSNNSLDLLRDLKTGVLLQKQFVQDATFLNAREALQMVTIEGAKAIDMADKIGSLEVGKLADIISLDLAGVNLNPLHTDHLDNLYSAVVYSAVGANVADVFVGGELLLQDGKPLRVDTQEIRTESQSAAKSIMTKAGLL